ncbi:MAG: M20 family metallopeptidase [Armatimonadota bacterium]|nr:M20 family metallopeptidase [Armatimonadota bacterium]
MRESPWAAPLGPAVEAAASRAVALRHELHAWPELAFEERRTAALVAERLRALGALVREGIGGTGVVGLIQGASPGPVVALRADMDALPIEEQTGAPYRSRIDGKMHACGHDGHTALLLGVAEVLARLRRELPGTVKLLFQPAEERGGGAGRLVAAGVLRDPDVAVIVALHAWPDLHAGQIGLRAGPILASVDTFRIAVQGSGGHGAHPDRCVDPVLVAARVVDALQSIVSREVNPLAPAVVTVGSIQGGTAANIIPDTVKLEGTVRTLNEETRRLVREALIRLVHGVAAAHGATAEVEYRADLPVTVNDAEVTAFLRTLAGEVLGAPNVVEIPEPSLGGEDFSLYLQHVPGAMVRLGVGPGRPGLHSSGFDFNDEALEPGMLLLAMVALRYATNKSVTAP